MASAMDAISWSSLTPSTSPADNKLYEVAHLANGLRVVVVHEPVHVSLLPTSVAQAEVDSERDDDDDDASTRSTIDADSISQSSEAHSQPDAMSESIPDADSDVHGSRLSGALRSIGTSSRMQSGVKAAAALSVAVGSFSDPSWLPGLAHLVEHMVFMGNAEYPQENALDSFLSDHGGSDNAVTYAEHTCYYFDVNPCSMYDGLQR